jgi:hypothetical protein
MIKSLVSGLLVAGAVAAGVVHAQSADDPHLQWGPCPAFLPDGCRIAVLNGDPAKPNADVYFKVPAKTALPTHWHTSA